MEQRQDSSQDWDTEVPRKEREQRKRRLQLVFEISKGSTLTNILCMEYFIVLYDNSLHNETSQDKPE